MHSENDDIKKHKKEFNNIYKELEGALTVEDALKLKPNPILVRNYYKKFCTRIYENLELNDGDKVLDAGCGQGFDLKNLSSIYPNCTFYGFDISEIMTEMAIKIATNSHIFLAIGEKIPVKDATFSNVYSREVIEHVIDPYKYVFELARVTKKGGIIIITTPNADALYNKYYLKRKTKNFTHKDEFLRFIELKNLLDRSNLSVEKVIYDGFLYYLLSGAWTRVPRLTSIVTKIIVPLSSYFEKIPILNKMFCDQMAVVARK